MLAPACTAPPGLQVKSELGIETVGELAAMPLPRLESAFGEKDAQWLHALALGVTGGCACCGQPWGAVLLNARAVGELRNESCISK